MSQMSLFPELGGAAPEPGRKKSRLEVFEDYDAFVEKFKPKVTTDDCLTPPAVYEAVRAWVDANLLPLDGVEVVRPFWPGGNYENADYPEGCLVLDNPPFSMLAKIRRFYHAHGVRYFLFAPSLTLANTGRDLEATYIICGHQVVYQNGAQVATSFITNLDCDGTRIWCAGDLATAIKRANGERDRKPELPAYEYPATVTSPALLQKVSKGGVTLRIHRDSCAPCNVLASQRAAKKGIFGGGWLLSERAAAERAAAERAAAERAAAERAAAERAAARTRIYWPLSEEEQEIIRNLK